MPDEDRPDRRRPAQVVQQLVGNVARAQVREKSARSPAP